MKNSDQERVNKIYEYASKLTKYVRDNDITREALMTDFSLQWLVTTPLYNIGQHWVHHNLRSCCPMRSP